MTCPHCHELLLIHFLPDAHETNVHDCPRLDRAIIFRCGANDIAWKEFTA